MKTAGNLIRIAGCILFMISSVLFMAVSGWQLFSGDWRLFENNLPALVHMLIKLLLSLYCLALSLKAAFRKNGTALWEGIQLLAVSLTAAPLVSNRLGWLFVLFSAPVLLSDAFARRFSFGKSGKDSA